ncbi:MAG: sugar phosphate isomerase/epimerase [Oscillospiraceae bacterium]|nr:sugar phosphate isomerase/epimerase [Oscillospiraceae bacterium]
MKTGYHAVYSNSFFDGIDDAYKYGFDFVQFELGVSKFFLENLTTSDLKKIKMYAKDKNIEITFHSPGDNVSLFCDPPLIRKGILDECKLILEKANILNARHITFHAGIYSQFKKSGDKQDYSNLSYYEDILYENIKFLLSNCGDILICVENYLLNQTIRNVVKKLIDEKTPLFLTLDVAKMYNGIDIIQDDYNLFVEYKDYIREMHIHDRNKEYGSHQTVGTGTVDFKLFQKFYNEKVYVNFEVRPVELASLSKDNLIKIWERDDL